MNGYTKVENRLLGEKYYYKKHKSGLDIYVFPKKMSSSYAIFGTAYGSLDNTFSLEGEDGMTKVPDGIAHFLEHKMFENDDGVDTFVRYAKTGANANAYTTFNRTCYLFSATDRIYESLEILLDFVTKPYFTPETVAKEQGIIAQEIRMGEDNPGRRLFFNLAKAMYESSAVRIEVAGTVESISEISAELLYKCYNAFYRPSNMALCLCGAFTPDAVDEVVDRYITGSQGGRVIRSYPAEKTGVVSELISCKMQVSKPLFGIGVKCAEISADPEERMKRQAAANILMEILFSKSSGFFNTLYEKQLITGNYSAGYDLCAAYSFAEITGEASNPTEVYEYFKKYVGEMKAAGIDDESFERCRRVVYSAGVKNFDSTEEISDDLIGFALDGGNLFEYIDYCGTVTKEEVEALFNDLFRDECYALSVVEPVDGAAAPEEEDEE